MADSLFGTLLGALVCGLISGAFIVVAMHFVVRFLANK